MRRIMLVLLLVALGNACAADYSIVIGKGASSLETQAAAELRKYLYAATGTLLPITNSAKGDAIAVGTTASNPLVARLKPNVSKLGAEGYLIRTLKDGKRKVLMVTGKTPNGVLYGAYTLLEQYGFGFYLGGDAVPVKKPFKLLDVNISRTPAFKIRGTLPWYNFFDSPTTWDYQDYCWFFDNLIKTKNNFIGFHAYDYEPFCAYKDGGKYVYGEPVASTDTPTWGTHSMKTSEFGFGTGKYFPDEYFGSKPSLYRSDRERSIRDSQDLLKKALDYAHYRGLKTCLGFEVTGADPTDPVAVENLDKRLRHLIAQYPMLDYVWIWEQEAMGLNGINPPALDSRLGSYYRKYEQDFAYLKEPRRIAEAVRLAVYTNEAYRILKEIAPDKRLILSGWGGDNHLKCSDFYVGLDKIVPKDVVFSALDDILTSPFVSAAYGKLSPEREKWPIPWFEFDGDQWHNQANTEHWYGALQDAYKKGSQGILGIHWRTRDVEESHALMSQFAWNPKLTYAQFYADYAKKTFGPEHAAEMAKMLMDLQALGYRWVGGAGQTECGGFAWGTPADPEKVKKLEAIRTEVQVVRDDLASEPGYERQAEYASYLYNTIDWTLKYEQTAQALMPDGEVMKLLLKARAEKAAGNDSDSVATATEGMKTLEACDFGAALDACARRVTDKGSMGILATVNTKAFWSYREVEREVFALMGLPGSFHSPIFRVGTDLQSADRVQLISANTVWPAGTPMPVCAFVATGTNVVKLHYRQIASQEEKTIHFFCPLDSRYSLCVIPGSEMNGKGIEFALEPVNASFDTNERDKLTWRQVLLVPAVPALKPNSAPKPVVSKISNVTVKPGEGCALIVQWQGSLARYEISRSENGGAFEPVFTTTGTWYEDREVKPSASYRYSVKPVGGKAVESLAVTCPGAESMPAPTVTATPKRGKVWLQWGKASLGISGYRVYTAPFATGPWTLAKTANPIPPQFYGDHLQVVNAEPGKQNYYRVVPVDRSGNEGMQSLPVQCVALPLGDMNPVLAEDFSPLAADRPEPGRTVGGQPLIDVVNGVSAAYFKKGDYLAFDSKPEFNAEMELSLSMWLKLEYRGDMPVVLGHGLWSMDGYFLQIYNNGVRFNLEGVGTLDAGHIEPGKWYHIAATYDGIAMKVYVDGQEVGSQQASGMPKPSGRNLYIGRYEYPDDQYRTDCHIAAVRIYTVGLTGEEVAAEYNRLTDKLK